MLTARRILNYISCMSVEMSKIDTHKNRVRKPRSGMHREDIKAALKKAGVTPSTLSRDNEYSRNAVSDTINGRWWPSVEKIIADALDKEAYQIWPERYNDYGQPVQQGNPNMVKLSHAGRPRNVQLTVVK